MDETPTACSKRLPIGPLAAPAHASTIRTMSSSHSAATRDCLRSRAIAIYRKGGGKEHYGREPAFEIRGPDSKLAFSDGVAFVPPDNRYVAACNLALGTISFYRRLSLTPVRFEATPSFELSHESVYQPDGLAFSSCGRWLATANHGGNTVSVFKRRSRIFAGHDPVYGLEPVTVIRDEDCAIRIPSRSRRAPIRSW